MWEKYQAWTFKAKTSYAIRFEPDVYFWRSQSLLTDTECTPVWRLYPTRTSNGQPKFSQLVDNSAVAYGAFYGVFCCFQLSDVLSEQLFREKR